MARLPLKVHRTEKMDAASPCAIVAAPIAPVAAAGMRVHAKIAPVQMKRASSCEILMVCVAVVTGASGTTTVTAAGGADAVLIGAAMVPSHSKSVRTDSTQTERKRSGAGAPQFSAAVQ